MGDFLVIRQRYLAIVTIWFLSMVELNLLGSCHVHVVVRTPEPSQHGGPGKSSASITISNLSLSPMKGSVPHDDAPIS